MKNAIKFQLCSEDNHPRGLPVRVIDLVTEEHGDRLVVAGKAKYVEDAAGFLVGYQLVGAKVVYVPPKPRSLSDPEPTAATAILENLPSGRLSSPWRKPERSSAAFSRAENLAVAGLRGESRTARMSEEKKKARILRNLEPEDLVELATKKYEVYADVH
jgi:hypothetical protein